MMSFGFCTSDLAITTFCWLPPDSSMTLALLLIARMLSALVQLSASAFMSDMLTIALFSRPTDRTPA
jgi:hypothetical protein